MVYELLTCVAVLMAPPASPPACYLDREFPTEAACKQQAAEFDHGIAEWPASVSHVCRVEKEINSREHGSLTVSPVPLPIPDRRE
jgi:hypothetical protein